MGMRYLTKFIIIAAVKEWNRYKKWRNIIVKY